MIVVDTNVIAYLIINGTFTERAKKVFAKDPNWIVPILWRYELINILATLVNTERAELNTVIYHFESIQKILSKFEREASFANVLSISTQYKISAYDAQFVALAMELDLPLITQDKHVLKKIPNLAQSMSQFIS